MKRNKALFYTVFWTLTLFTLFIGIDAHAQNNSSLDSIDISLLTCEPHDEVYSLYGHTAIRIDDHRDGQDLAVNYGVFDQSKPFFVLRFIFGLTDYTMAFMPMNIFTEEYRYFGSAVREQVLNLTDEEKANILNALNENYEPENRVYRYNFFYNNCTTKARDIIVDNLDGEVIYKPSDKKFSEMSFRDLIHWKNEGYNWCAVGNDLLLGVGADQSTSVGDRQFLPEVLMNDFESAKIKDKDGTVRPLVKSSRWIIPHGESRAETMGGFPLTPLACSIVILLISIVLTFAERFYIHHRIKWFDYLFFYCFGLLGLILTAMIFSQHPTVQFNLQIMIFSPLWLGLVWILGKKKWATILSFTMFAVFFAGAFFQDYAEGMMCLALSLLVRLLNILYDKK